VSWWGRMPSPPQTTCTTALCPNTPVTPGLFWEEKQWWPVAYCDECAKALGNQFHPYGVAPSDPKPTYETDPEWADRVRRGFNCHTCAGTGRTTHNDMPDGSSRAQTCLTCAGTGKQPTPDDALLADLFRRALKAEIISTKTHFHPSWHITLVPGDPARNEWPRPIELTDAEIDAFRRSV
jgi:hypothetical protein